MSQQKSSAAVIAANAAAERQSEAAVVAEAKAKRQRQMEAQRKADLESAKKVTNKGDCMLQICGVVIKIGATQPVPKLDEKNRAVKNLIDKGVITVS